MKASYFAGLIGLAACASVNPWSQHPEPVAGLPDRFVADSSFTDAAPSDSTCLVHLIDPATQTRLLLGRSSRHSTGAIGDYKVEPEGRYGFDPRHLLRVECRTGRPLGKVPK